MHREAVFDFMTDAWFATPPARFRRIVVVAVLLAATVVLSMLPFGAEILKELGRR